jgi:hypothetical protein
MFRTQAKDMGDFINAWRDHIEELNSLGLALADHNKASYDRLKAAQLELNKLVTLAASNIYDNDQIK